MILSKAKKDPRQRQVCSDWFSHSEFREYAIRCLGMNTAELDDGFERLVERGYLERESVESRPPRYRMTIPNPRIGGPQGCR